MKIVFLSCVMRVESDFHKNNPRNICKYIFLPTVTAAEYVTEELAKCYMLPVYKDPLLEIYKARFFIKVGFNKGNTRIFRDVNETFSFQTETEPRCLKVC